MIKKFILRLIFVSIVLMLNLFSCSSECKPLFGNLQKNTAAEELNASLSYKKSVLVDGRHRSYYVYAPSDYSPSKSYPVLFVFHGGEGNANNILKITKFKDYIDKYQFILIAPNGSNRFENELFLMWNAGHCRGYASEAKINDSKFVNTIIDQTADSYNIDRKRIYLTGLSNGAMLSYKIACQLSGKIAGVAPVGGAMNYIPKSAKSPIPVVVFHGTADRHVLFKGGIPLDFFEEKTRVDNSVSKAVSFWVKNNKCSQNPIIVQNGNVSVYKYLHSEDNTPVILYKITGGKHAWPGGERDFPFGDKPTNEINASQIILDAFMENKY